VSLSSSGESLICIYSVNKYRMGGVKCQLCARHLSKVTQTVVLGTSFTSVGVFPLRHYLIPSCWERSHQGAERSHYDALS
jgi:hypothetical protein